MGGLRFDVEISTGSIVAAVSGEGCCPSICVRVWWERIVDLGGVELGIFRGWVEILGFSA